MKPYIEYIFEMTVKNIILFEDPNGFFPVDLCRDDPFNAWVEFSHEMFRDLAKDKDFVSCCKKLSELDELNPRYETLTKYIENAHKAIFPILGYIDHDVYRKSGFLDLFRHMVVKCAKDEERKEKKPLVDGFQRVFCSK